MNRRRLLVGSAAASALYVMRSSASSALSDLSQQNAHYAELSDALSSPWCKS